MLDSSSYPLAHHGNQLRDLFSNGSDLSITLYPALDEESLSEGPVIAKLRSLSDHIQERFSGLPYLDLTSTNGHLLAVSPVNNNPRDGNGTEIEPSIVQFDENGDERAFYWVMDPSNLRRFEPSWPSYLRLDLPISNIRRAESGRIYKFSADDLQFIFPHQCYSTTDYAGHLRYRKAWEMSPAAVLKAIGIRDVPVSRA